jgi:hypothetical protein
MPRKRRGRRLLTERIGSMIKVQTKATAEVLMLALATVIATMMPVRSSAAPVTVYFQGVSTTYRDHTGTVIAEKAGLGFSGSLTFDIALAENFKTVTSPFMTHASATSYRGCLSIVNGACTNDYGNGTPVVLDYRVFASFAPAGTYRAMNHVGAEWYDSSWRENTRLVPALAPPDGSDTYSVGRLEQKTFLVGDVPSGLYTSNIVAQDVSLSLISMGTGLHGEVLDLDATPNFAVVPLGQDNFAFNYANVTARTCPTCAYDYRLTSDSFSLSGSLISFRVLHDLEVPEPSSLALAGASLLGAVFAGQRRRRRSAVPMSGRSTRLVLVSGPSRSSQVAKWGWPSAINFRMRRPNASGPQSGRAETPTVSHFGIGPGSGVKATRPFDCACHETAAATAST